MEDNSKNNMVGVLDKSINVLEFLIDWPYGVSLAKISKGVSLNKSTVYRILSTFKAHGYVSQNPMSGEYKLTYKFINFARVYNNTDIRSIALPYMRQVTDITGYSVNLTVINDCHATVIDRTEAITHFGSVKVQAQVGTNVPWHSSSTGKTLLAGLVDEEIKAIIAKSGMTKYTERTITNLDDLFIELNKVRKNGYCVEYLENEPNVVAIAAPIKNSECISFSSVSISGIEGDISVDDIHKLARMIIDCAAAISKDVGCPDYSKWKYRPLATIQK